MSKITSRYSVGFGSYTADGNYEQVAETGPYRTRLGAYLAVRKWLGRKVSDLPEKWRIDWPIHARRDSRFLGATIERFTDEDGTQGGWDYSLRRHNRVRLTNHWQNWYS